MRRPARRWPQDVRFLRDMLHHAYYWKERAPDEGPGPVQLYVKAWGRPGDTAVIAIDDGFPVGAAWFRLFHGEQPGYGFVDEQTPELAIAVVPNARGQGASASAARRRCSSAPGRTAIRRFSLCVDKRTPARSSSTSGTASSASPRSDDSLTMRRAARVTSAAAERDG